MKEVTVSDKDQAGHVTSYVFQVPDGFQEGEFKFRVFGGVKFLIQEGMKTHFYDADKKWFVPVPQ